MQLVLLAGELGEKYGQEHEYYNLQTPADAIKLLCINYPALKAELFEAHKNGVGYRVIQGGAAMGYDELQLPFGSKPLLVVPVITGSGGGSVTQILLGVGLVATSFLLPGAGLFGASAFGAFGGPIAAAGTLTTVGTALSAVGASMILSGTANLLSPQPELPKANRIRGEGSNVRGPGPDGITRGASGKQSYAFTGPANTVGTGTTLPVIYGRVIAGSHLVAANLDVTDNSDPLQIATQTPGIETIKINGENLTTRLKDCGGIESRRGTTLNELIVNSSDTNRSTKVAINKIFGPPSTNSNQTQRLKDGAEYRSNANNGGWPALRYKEDRGKRKKIDVIFKIAEGLHDFVSEEGSTKIDGFITYEITLTITTGGADIPVASARITVQGLTNANQNVVFGHRLEMPRVQDRNNDDLAIKVEIIEVGLLPTATFQLQSYGYDLLAPST
jgi:predicted phage tail protein